MLPMTSCAGDPCRGEADHEALRILSATARKAVVQACQILIGVSSLGR
jgi:hypothetical protein